MEGVIREEEVLGRFRVMKIGRVTKEKEGKGIKTNKS